MSPAHRFPGRIAATGASPGGQPPAGGVPAAI